MKTLCFANRKGGVGKTTSALNVSAALADDGQRVLLVDLDPQGNLTQSLVREEIDNTVFTVVLGECSLVQAVKQVDSNLILLPCNNTFSRFEKHFAGESDAQYILSDFLDSVREYYSQQIDYIVLDCPPSMGLITINAFVASDSIFVPMEAQQFSLDGLKQVNSEVDKIRKRQNKHLKLGGIFFTRHNRRTYIAKDMIDLLENNYPDLLMDSYIRRNVALEESPSMLQNIFQYDPESNGAKDYTRLTKEILTRL